MQVPPFCYYAISSPAPKPQNCSLFDKSTKFNFLWGLHVAPILEGKTCNKSFGTLFFEP